MLSRWHHTRARSGHGLEDFGAVDFNGTDVIAGAFDGYIVRYINIGSPGDFVPPTQVVYDSGGFETLTDGSLIGQPVKSLAVSLRPGSRR